MTVLELHCIELHCMDCRRVRAFEQPECIDSHGADCPEWVCTSCGSAVFTSVSPLDQTVAQTGPGLGVDSRSDTAIQLPRSA